MTPTPVSDEFDMIFGAADGTDDEAVKSRLAISPPKLRSASSLKILSSSAASVPSVEVIGRTEDDQVDYELESSNEQINETPRKRAILEPAGYGSFLDDDEKTPRKTVSAEAGDLESAAVRSLMMFTSLAFIRSLLPRLLSCCRYMLLCCVPSHNNGLHRIF
jgi:hypothetical protein